MKRPPKILVVEDDENTSDLIREILKHEGMQTSAAWDGREALRAAEEDRPDLILMNVAMPRMDGFEACRRLRRNPKTSNMPIIFVTGQQSVDQLILGYDLDAEHYITKPFHPRVLAAQVRNALRRTGGRLTPPSRRSSKNPRVFISYKWESDARNDWVVKLAVDLRSAGIDVSLDRWDVRLGDSFTDYMTSKIDQADVVLFVTTTASVRAVEASGKAGGAVKFEMQLATSRRLAGQNLRIIPIYREGDKPAAHLRGLRYADFRNDANYRNALQMLVIDLLSAAPGVRPNGKR